MVDQPPSAVLVVAHALTNGSDTPQQEHSWDISLPAPPDRDLVAVTHRVDPYGHPTSVRASRATWPAAIISGNGASGSTH
jgi:hypothetical protein